MKIADREIGEGHTPYLIAELSCNHGGKIENAIRLIKLAKRAGADAIKTQCYEPHTITMNMRKPDFIVQDGLWKGRTLWDLYADAQTPFSWQKDLYQCAHDEGITIFSSVFDRSAVDYLETLGCPAYKIASMEVVDTVLIEHAAETGKPLIISTGMASTREILDAHEASNGKAAFLHCTSEYPATPEGANLPRMVQLQRLLPESIVGISDHSKGSTVPIAATALGTRIIEKHFGLLQGVKSEDDTFSLSANDFLRMAKRVRMTWEAMQLRLDTPNPTRQMRRSLYASADIKEGEAFTEENVKSIRPGYGLPCKMFRVILGKEAKRDFRKGDPLSL